MTGSEGAGIAGGRPRNLRFEPNTNADMVIPPLSMFQDRINHGQGKTAMTILTEGGCNYPVIHEPYSHRAHYDHSRSVRSPSAPARVRRGERPMHQTTMTIAKPPWDADFTTTTNHYFSGSDALEPVRRPPKCRSMHRSQFSFGKSEEPDHFTSDHMETYHEKDIIPANRLHLISMVNRLNQTEGAKVKEVVRPQGVGVPNNWSQYTRVHNKLGALRGPGVEREMPVRAEFDVITGQEKGPAWSPTNSRVSGNRVLHSHRREVEQRPLLF